MTNIEFNPFNRSSLTLLTVGTGVLAVATFVVSHPILMPLYRLIILNGAIAFYAMIMFVAHSPRERSGTRRARSVIRVNGLLIVSMFAIGIIAPIHICVHHLAMSTPWIDALFLVVVALSGGLFYYAMLDDDADSNPTALAVISVFTTYVLVGGNHHLGFIGQLPVQVDDLNFVVKMGALLVLGIIICSRAMLNSGRRSDEMRLQLESGPLAALMFPLVPMYFFFKMLLIFVEEIILAILKMVSIRSVVPAVLLSVIIILSAHLENALVTSFGTINSTPDTTIPLFPIWILLALVLFVAALCFEFSVDAVVDVIISYARSMQISVNLVTSMLLLALLQLAALLSSVLVGWPNFPYRPFSASFLTAAVLFALCSAPLYFWLSAQARKA